MNTITELVAVLDLTSLSPDDTPARIRELCRRARSPLGRSPRARTRVAAVCIYPAFFDLAREALAGSGVRVAVVAGGFPDGLSHPDTRVAEVEAAAAAGADEIDVVIARHRALDGDWSALYEEVRGFRHAAASATLKVIIAASELRSMPAIARASATCLLAGADFLKTSTGREARPASIQEGAVMMRAIRRHEQEFGAAAGFKAAGGIRSVADALAWRSAFVEIVGAAPEAGRFRIGASKLLDELRAASEREDVGVEDRRRESDVQPTETRTTRP